MAGLFSQGEHDVRRGLRIPGADRTPYVTWVLLAANIIVWLAMSVSGGSQDPDVLLDFGAMYGPFIADGEYWRLFTAMFLHVGLTHLLFNGFGLLIFGQLVERIYGPYRFIAIYVLAGLTGSVASYLFNTDVIGAGASGALFGILGALGAFFAARRDLLGEVGQQNLIGIAVLAGINLVFGFSTSGIDNFAHMGGLVGGVVLGYALVPNYNIVINVFGFPDRLVEAKSFIRAWWIVPLVVFVLATVTLLGTSSRSDSVESLVLNAERLLDEGKINDSLDELRQAFRNDPGFGRTYYVHGRLLIEVGDFGAAREQLGRAIQLGDRGTRNDALSLLVRLGSG